MKKYLLLILGILLFVGLFLGFQKPADLPRAKADDTTQYQTTFTDVPIDYWGYWYIEAVKQAGITLGVSENPPLFGPNMTLTRSQLAVFMIRATNKVSWMNTNCRYWTTPTFADVPQGYWAFCNIEGAWRAGLFAQADIDYPLPETGQKCYFYGKRAFCPEGSSSQYLARQTVYRGAGRYEIPSGYTPAYTNSYSSVINRAQFFSLIAWNFNPNLTVAFSGTVTDAGTTTGMIPQARAATGIPGVTVAIAGTPYSTTTDSSGNFKVNVISAPLRDVFSKVGTQYTANFSGGNIQSFSRNFTLSSSKIFGNYQASNDMVTISGTVGSTGCESPDIEKQYYNGITVSVYDNTYPSLPVFITSATTNIATWNGNHYTYSLSFPRYGKTNFLVKATGVGFFDANHADFVDPAQKTLTDNIALTPKSTILKGKVVDERSGAPLSNMVVYAESSSATYSKTKKDGLFKLIFTDTKGVDSVVLPSVRPLLPTGYTATQMIDEIATSNCPLFQRIYKMDKSPICDLSVNNIIDICFYGEEAKQMRDRDDRNIWEKAWADKIAEIRERTGSKRASGIDVISGVYANYTFYVKSLGYDPGFGRIFLGAVGLLDGGGPTADGVKSEITHEYGHLYGHLDRPEIRKTWERLYLKGKVLPGQSQWLLTSSSNYAWGTQHDEYSALSVYEFFPEVFTIIENYQPQFITNISSTSGALNSWLKQVYNAQAKNFTNPSISPLSMLQDLAYNILHPN